MPLPLTAALVDQILFAMEDQDTLSVLNLSTREVEACADENACSDHPVLPLPPWSSTDGFRMMREFSSSLHNPAVEAELRAILDSGQGVFRRFKQVLKPREALYRQWLRFKRKFMEERVRAWLEEWPEVVFDDPGAPALGAETPELLASDFGVREGEGAEAPGLEAWDARACLEVARAALGPQAGPGHADAWRRGRRFGDGDRFWVAETPQGEWAGVIWGRPWGGPAPAVEIVEVALWFVVPEYRGLGLGAKLLDTLRTAWGPDPTVVVGTPGGETPVEGALGRSGFRPAGRWWVAPGRS